jgi:hypothetical protein
MKKYLFILFALITITSYAQSPDEAAILEVMKQQEEAWNNYDLEGFMQGYWNNEALKFYGSRGITYGWKQTLENYKKGYPDKSHAGQLRFEIEDATAIEENSYYVMGRFFLKREVGDAQGIFMLIFKRIEGQWKIVADMSCG